MMLAAVASSTDSRGMGQGASRETVRSHFNHPDASQVSGLGHTLTSHVFRNEPKLTQSSVNKDKDKDFCDYPLGQCLSPELPDFWRSSAGSYIPLLLKEIAWEVAQLKTLCFFALS